MIVMALPSKLLLLIVPAINGAILTITLYALDVGFWKSVAVAVISATVSGVFLLVSTYVIIKEARTNREAIHEVRAEQRDVKAKLDSPRRVRQPGDRRKEPRRSEDR